MKKLWIYGDSFSSPINFNDVHENVTKYLSIKNIESYKSWPELLNEKLGYELINYAKGGKSNYQIFFDFCDSINEINENDIVIVGWALIGKFIIANENRFIDIHPHGAHNHYEMRNESIQEFIENRKNKIWVTEIYRWQNLINSLARVKNFKVIFWSGEEEVLKNSSINLDNCLRISDETNWEISDTHLGMDGHINLSDNFYKILKDE